MRILMQIAGTSSFEKGEVPAIRISVNFYA